MHDTSDSLILIVDDEAVNRLILESNLKKNGFRVIAAATGQECLNAAKDQQPALILLDIIMPGMDGFQTCEQLKSSPATRDIPVIFLSALTDTDIKTKGFSVGGVDYVSKPFDTKELLARVHTHLTLRSQENQLRAYSENLEEMVEERTKQLKQAEQKLQRNYDMQTALNQLLHLTLQDLPLDKLLQQCLESILGISWLDLQNRGCIYLKQPHAESLHMVAHSNLPEHVLEQCATIIPNNCACGKAIGEETVITVRDDQMPHNASLSKIAEPHNHVCIPIKSKTNTLAVLNLYIARDRLLTEQETIFFQAVANTLMQMILYKQAEQNMLHHVFHEPLTNLPNRTALLDRLNSELAQLQQDEDYKFALVLINLDSFNRFNESLGYDLGDKLILSSAQRLLIDRKEDEEVLHLGGDEFALLLRDLQEVVSPYLLAEQLLEILREPHRLDSHELEITASAGVVLSNPRYERGEDLLRDADIALHQAKTKGRGKFAAFSPAMHEKARQSMQTFMDLRSALSNNEFVLFYQPIIHLPTGQATGVEALIRWKHPTRGMVSPGEFIPLAEETGLIVPMGRWVLEQACEDMLDFARNMDSSQPFMLSVNLSGKQFAQDDLYEQIEAILEYTGFPPHFLKLEITESVVMDNAEAAVRIMERLKQLNVKISIDDFGTGYSSLSYLHRFSADILKVDRSFVSRMHIGGENLEIIRTIITLAQALKMQVIAEGVETEKELEMLLELNCEHAQGFYFARPMPLEDLRASELMGMPQQTGSAANLDLLNDQDRRTGQDRRNGQDRRT
jgi:diguanylate cyclase (GGDEF)-like protein